MEEKKGIKLCIAGISGKMGGAVLEASKKHGEIVHVAGVDKYIAPLKGAEVFSPDKANKALEQSDVLLVLFNNAEDAVKICEFAESFGLKKVVVGTTGLNDSLIKRLRNLAKKMAVLQSNNFSAGIYFMNSQVHQIAKKFPEAPVEIIEVHHGQKRDAPSGTALMLAETVCKARGLNPEKVIICGRGKGINSSRESFGEIEKIWIHSIRGGEIAGEHEVMFFLKGQILTIKHSAAGRQMFAEGALMAVRCLSQKPIGWYTMKDVFDK